MGELKSAPVAELASKNRITAEDVVMLRREVFGDGVVTRSEAEALFALDAIEGDKCAEWPDFFIEADHRLHRSSGKAGGLYLAGQCRLAGPSDFA